MIKTYFNWSTGKDAALAFYHLSQNEKYSIEHLLTSVNTHFNRVSMHGLRRELMERQVAAMGLPHTTIELPEQPDMEEYESIMLSTVSKLKSFGLTTAAFGDIFLEDLKTYRENQLSKQGIDAIFPLWKRNTKDLLHEFLDLGFKAIIVCTKASLLDESFAGRVLDKDFIKDLPPNVDPCGENGEFHTFCFDGPIFKNPISFEVGEKIYKEYKAPKDTGEDSMGFWFCDLVTKS